MAETFLYVTTTGRITGNPHTIEIWYVEHDGCVVFCAEGRYDSDTVKNIQQDAHVSFHISEREDAPTPQAGIASIVTDASAITELETKFTEKYNWNNGLFVQICPS
ncbi:MAG: pyridoxamine 5'-phosphate oxidase family protein [Chloroflexota bacterium]